MDKSGFQTRRNVMSITSISSFSSIKGGYRANCRDVYFIRCIGCGANYLTEIQEMDRLWKEKQECGQGHYLRLRELPKLQTPEQAGKYISLFEEWRKEQENGVPLEGAKAGSVFRAVLSKGLSEACELFRTFTPAASETMERNFLTKMLFWTENLMGSFLHGWDEKTNRKFVYSGTAKLQEYLFCYFLTLLGVDVMMLLPARDIVLAEELKGLSAAVTLGETKDMEIPPYTHEWAEVRERPQAASCGTTKAVSIERTDRKTRRSGADVERPAASSQENTGRVPERRELEFEELARLASSVVMIAVHDPEGEVVCTGSGIMIGKGGYILTNHHVAGKGVSYSVRIEDDETIYESDELIKYNHFQDLAILRIDKMLNPIPLYKGDKPLVRGQKVVAIGSPLGLFNSVSDGIISGFRTIGDVDMIQFTAPISSGSSGGAVLNMQGEIIGISTAGFDSGQNINLAVDYRTVAAFVRGFV